ncbi:MAG: helix-turn-helix domain-containing protein [Paludibacteraceae bacterium]|nr:helix-turn-helix domain-containing protein [Paludibacteraceae bacterium]
MEEKMLLGRNLKILREINDYTQDKMASFLNIGRSAYANYESGERELPLSLMERLSDLFGCDLSVFYEEDESNVKSLLSTAFRIESLSDEDMKQIALLKSIVKNYIKMENLLCK